MSNSKIPFSLDWNAADFSNLECEELLLRNTYLNSQMGPLADFHVLDNANSGRRQRLFWADNSTDERADKGRLEKPGGGDFHNSAASCKRDQHGQPILVGVLKKQRHSSTGAKAAPATDFAWDSRSENPEVCHPWVDAGAANANPMLSAPKVVPTAWGVDNEPGPAELCYGNSGFTRGVAAEAAYSASNGTVPQLSSQDMAAQLHQAQRQMQMQGPERGRGPANNIRDSLSGLSSSRRTTPEPRFRPNSRDSRDPSPKPSTNVKRGESPGVRNESPMRMLNKPGGSQRVSGSRGASPAPVVHSAGSGGLSFSMGIRAPGPSRGSFGSGSAGSSGGMGSFRSGGPVKATVLRNSDAEVAGDQANNFSNSQRRPRSANSRRPPSPQARAPSPGKSMTSSGGMPQQPRHRSQPSYLRRAPSPTPNFNRGSSVGKPRWH